MRKVIVQFREETCFNKILIYHHDEAHFPKIYTIFIWEDSDWKKIFHTEHGEEYIKPDLRTTPLAHDEFGSTPTYNYFEETYCTKKIKYEFCSYDRELFGWIHSFEVYHEKTAKPVDIDIKPDCTNNPVNVNSNGVIPVAIYTTDSFDATTIDASTLSFGPYGAHIAHNNGHIEDVDGDGDLDLLVHFRTQQVGIICGQNELFLTGNLYDGTPITGSDTITPIGCP